MKTWIAILGVMVLATGCFKRTASKEDMSVAYDLARDGKIAELRTLLRKKPAIATTPYRGKSTLLDITVDIRPAFSNMHQVIETFLVAGADPNHDAPHILRKAIWRGDPEGFLLLLKYGGDPTVVCEKKKLNMLEYARTYDDRRMNIICDAWERGSK